MYLEVCFQAGYLLCLCVLIYEKSIVKLKQLLKKKPVIAILLIILFGIIAQVIIHYWPKPDPVVKSAVDRSNEQFIERYDTSIKESKDNKQKAAAILKKANYISSDDPKEAEKLYKEAEKLDTTNSELLFVMCNYYYMKQNASEANTYCQKAKEAIKKTDYQTANLPVIEKMLSNIKSGNYDSIDEL